MSIVSTLKSLVPQRNLTVGQTTLTFHGLGLVRVADLLLRHPAVQAAFGEQGLSPERLLAEVPAFLVDCLAASLRDESEEAKEAIAGLGPSHILPMVETMFDLTMPDGMGPFVEELKPLLAKLGVGAPQA